MQFNVTTRPFRQDKWDIRTTVIYDDKAISKMLNANLGIGSGFLIALENRILQTIEPYVPKLSGDLIASAHKNTYRGSGRIVWGGAALKRPYAVFQYYRNSGPPRPTGGQRGKHWVERWSNDNHIGRILREISPQFGLIGR